MTDNVIQFPIKDEEFLGYLIDGKSVEGCFIDGDDFGGSIAVDFSISDDLVALNYDGQESYINFDRETFIHFCVMCLGILAPENLCSADES